MATKKKETPEAGAAVQEAKLKTEDMIKMILSKIKREGIEKITVYDEKLVVEFKSGLTVEVEA